MDNEVRHVVEFGEKTLSTLAALTQAIKENNQLAKDGNPSEFAREVCANIYANIIMGASFRNL